AEKANPGQTFTVTSHAGLGSSSASRYRLVFNHDFFAIISFDNTLQKAVHFLALGVCGFEEVPRASPIRSTAQKEIRRAPVRKPTDAAPRAHGFKRTSTGVRRAPHISIASTRSPLQPKPMRAPLSVPVIPLSSMVPMGLPLVTFPPMMSMPPLPTFATIPMPTLPGLTMPPSFQRLMGITTPTPQRSKQEKTKSRKSERDDGEERSRQPTRSTEESFESYHAKFSPCSSSYCNFTCFSESPKSLSPVSSRLPKFVSSRKVSVVAPETNADWIVPF
ncbi:hypothetical protein GCK32_007544, partial [Trichostrongylus colubriformis]